MLIAPALLIVLGASDARAGQRGAVTGILSPSTAQAGTAITATITGTNPCGAVHIDWADGTAVTYAISELPATQSHKYEKAGSFTVVARGMGNCDGQATTGIRIDPAPSPPPDRPRLTSFTAPSPGLVGRPVTMTAHGSGTCRFTVEFGDGNSQEFTTPLPHDLRHVYAVTGSYTVVASAIPPCEGRQAVKLDIRDAEPKARLTSMEISPNPAAAPATVTITIAGSGKCSYAIDYGDGNSERRTAMLPEQVRHAYPAANTYIVKAIAEPPCDGTAETRLTVRTTMRGLTRVVITPNPTTVRTRVNITIDGRGTCPVSVDFGDGTDQSIEAPLPARISHTYERAGVYDVYVWADTPCTGDATASVAVRRPRPPMRD